MEELEEFTVRMFPIKRERRLVQHLAAHTGDALTSEHSEVLLPEPPVSAAPPSEKAPPNIQSRVRSLHDDVVKAALRLVTLRGTVLRRSAGLGEVREVPLGLVSPRGVCSQL